MCVTMLTLPSFAQTSPESMAHAAPFLLVTLNLGSLILYNLPWFPITWRTHSLLAFICAGHSLYPPLLQVPYQD